MNTDRNSAGEVSAYEDFVRQYIERHRDFYRNPASAYCQPFRIFGNLYYVGDKKVCAHLVDTGQGLILFDCGYQHTIHLLVQSIWELGFDPANIKYLFHTHGHFDHFGACNDLRTLYGCTSLMSRADAEMLRDNPDGALMEMNPCPYAKLPVIDQTFADQEVIALGNTSVRCVLTPGHSPGNTAFFFDVQDGQQVCRVGYFGGAGFNWLRKAFLDKYHFPHSLREDFMRSIKKVRPERVDIVLGSHPSQCGLLEKYDLMLRQPGCNPFIDTQEWERFLDELLAKYRNFLKQEPQKTTSCNTAKPLEQ